MSKIAEIREHLLIKYGDQTCNRDVISTWLAYDCAITFRYGLTLMPKKVFYKYVPSSQNVKNNMMYRHLTKEELVAANSRFFNELNKLVYKNAYKRFGKKLDAVFTIEGEASSKDLHSHFALSSPAHLNSLEFSKCVNHALRLNGQFLVENKNYKVGVDSADRKNSYKLDFTDCDWLHYITKELDKRHVHNLYLP